MTWVGLPVTRANLFLVNECVSFLTSVTFTGTGEHFAVGLSLACLIRYAWLLCSLCDFRLFCKIICQHTLNYYSRVMTSNLCSLILWQFFAQPIISIMLIMNSKSTNRKKRGWLVKNVEELESVLSHLLICILCMPGNLEQSPSTLDWRWYYSFQPLKS